MNLVAAGLLLLVGLAPAWLHYYGRRCTASSGGAGVVVVPGCRVYGNGELSPAFRRRVEAALRLTTSRGYRQLLISGGKTGGPCSEARAGADYALELGFEQDLLLLEEAARSTYENAKNSRELLGAVPIVVVTDPFHALRCRIVFRRFFNSVQIQSNASQGIRWQAGYREMLSLVKTITIALWERLGFNSV